MKTIIQKSSFMLLSLPAEVCPMKVKMLSTANSLVSPSHCWNTEATNRYQDDDIFSVQILTILSVQVLQEYQMLPHFILCCMVTKIFVVAVLDCKNFHKDL